MFPIFDTHAHYDDERFDPDRDEILSSLPDNGVALVLNAGTEEISSRASIEMAERYSHMYAAVGFHPHEADKWCDSSAGLIAGLTKHPKVVAIGEIGLDYHYDFSPRERQLAVFEQQLQLARELNMPVVIHDREAHGDMYELLRKYAPLSGVMHCFSGSAELAAETIRLGLHIGMGGSLTFKNARVPVEVAASIPIERLLLETDCPYMAPVPLRGRRCESPMISLVAEKIAQIRGITAEDVIKAATKNGCALYGISLELQTSRD